jgi:hypothetical protein
MSGTDADWASRVAGAIGLYLSRYKAEAHVLSVRAPTPDVVELIYAKSANGALRGVRMDSASIQSGPELLSESSIDELAFLVVHVAVLEPRSLEEFLPADGNGIRWLPMRRWMDEL